ncbi:serine acetyltransferase [bacterium]|nr:serine acetyltransferase [bacterium]
MYLSIEKNELIEYISKQINNIFPDKNTVSPNEVGKVIDNALTRLEFCFSKINPAIKYFSKDGIPYFNHMHSDQYCMFLWFLSNEAYLNDNINLAEKLFYLNKTLNCLDAFYSIKLPDVFMFCHPVGSIIGNAHYENYILIHQNVTIGASKEDIYPAFGEGIILYASSKVIGTSNISNNVIFAADASVVNEDIPANKLVFGQSKNLILKEHNGETIDKFFVRQ